MAQGVLESHPIRVSGAAVQAAILTDVGFSQAQDLPQVERDCYQGWKEGSPGDSHWRRCVWDRRNRFLNGLSVILMLVCSLPHVIHSGRARRVSRWQPMLRRVLVDKNDVHLLPEEHDGVVSPVKSQGQCSSCWACLITSFFEHAWLIATGSSSPLSDQQLVDWHDRPHDQRLRIRWKECPVFGGQLKVHRYKRRLQGFVSHRGYRPRGTCPSTASKCWYRQWHSNDEFSVEELQHLPIVLFTLWDPEFNAVHDCTTDVQHVPRELEVMVRVLECGGCSRSRAGPCAPRRTLSWGKWCGAFTTSRRRWKELSGTKRPCPCFRKIAAIFGWRNYMPCVCSELTRRRSPVQAVTLPCVQPLVFDLVTVWSSWQRELVSLLRPCVLRLMSRTKSAIDPKRGRGRGGEVLAYSTHLTDSVPLFPVLSHALDRLTNALALAQVSEKWHAIHTWFLTW